MNKMGVAWKSPQSWGRGNENVSLDDEEQKIPPEQITKMLSCIDPDDLSYEEWLKVGQSINTQLPENNGLKLWDNWSKKGTRYKPNECSIRWNGFDPTGPIRAGSLFYFAKENGWEPEVYPSHNNFNRSGSFCFFRF